MPWIISIIAGALGSTFLKFLPRIAINLLIALGIGAVSYTGLNMGLETILSQVSSYMGDLPAIMLTFVQLLGIPSGLSIVASAMIIRASFIGYGQGVKLGSFRKPKLGKLGGLNNGIDKALGNTVLNTRNFM